jgi:hypothetical protein
MATRANKPKKYFKKEAKLGVDVMLAKLPINYSPPTGSTTQQKQYSKLIQDTLHPNPFNLYKEALQDLRKQQGPDHDVDRKGNEVIIEI